MTPSAGHRPGQNYDTTDPSTKESHAVVQGEVDVKSGGDLDIESGGEINVLSGGDLDIESGAAFKIAGTAVSASAAELNITDGVTATAAELNITDDMTSGAQTTIAVAAEAGDAIAVTVTLKDAAGVAVNEARPVKCWLSSSATTGAIAVDDTITVTATTGLLVAELVDDLLFYAVTSTAGVLVLSIAHAGDATAKYLWVEVPGQPAKVSAVIDLA